MNSSGSSGGSITAARDAAAGRETAGGRHWAQASTEQLRTAAAKGRWQHQQATEDAGQRWTKVRECASCDEAAACAAGAAPTACERESRPSPGGRVSPAIEGKSGEDGVRVFSFFLALSSLALFGTTGRAGGTLISAPFWSATRPRRKKGAFFEIQECTVTTAVLIGRGARARVKKASDALELPSYVTG